MFVQLQRPPARMVSLVNEMEERLPPALLRSYVVNGTQYRQLRPEFNGQMDHACAIILHPGFGIKDQMHRLRIELENVERTAKQEAAAVGYANDRSCALHLDMLKADNQHQSFRNTLSLSITRLETEVESADIKPDEIMREFRGSLRTEYDCYAECEHHLAMEESQLRLQIARDESLQSQVVAAESRNAEGSASADRGVRICAPEIQT